MLTGFNTQRNERGRQIQTALVGFTKADRNKGARLFLPAEAWQTIVAERGIYVDLGKCGSVFEISHSVEGLF